MKTVNIILTAIAFLALSLTNVHADNRKMGGLILGGGAGAIVGQAVGRNAESTLAGAAIGGALGFIVGNEMDRRADRYSRSYGRYSQPYGNHHNPVFQNHDRKNHYGHYSRNCKRIVRVEKRHHRIKRVESIICRNYPRHNYRDHGHYRFNGRSYR